MHPPSEDENNDSSDEDVTSFNSVYKSEAAADYRQLLAKKAKDAFDSYMNAKKLQDETKMKLMHAMDNVQCDPFQQVFAQNRTSMGGTSGMINKNINNKHNASHNSGGNPWERSYDVGTPQIDLIKERIHIRRSMLRSSDSENTYGGRM